ncbi:MAG: hypothetical protein OEL69_09980 [Nitrosopumilus sp.]|jgi:hypothetical protein|nr:hypothetical protein [Nitrosopumilus sp.]
MNFDVLYDEVMKINELIRYAVVLSNTGEKISGRYRKGLTPLLNDEELKMIHFYAGQRWDTRKNLAHKIGNTKYAMAEYDKLKRMTLPINDKYLLMVSSEINTNHQEIINKVLDLIKNYSNIDSRL